MKPEEYLYDGRELLLFVPKHLDDFPLTIEAFRVYCHLERRSKNETRKAWPSLQSIGNHCFTCSYPNASPGTLKAKASDAVKELIHYGLIRKESVNEGKGYKHNMYHLTSAKEWDCSEQMKASRNIRKGGKKKKAKSVPTENSVSTTHQDRPTHSVSATHLNSVSTTHHPGVYHAPKGISNKGNPIKGNPLPPTPQIEREENPVVTVSQSQSPTPPSIAPNIENPCSANLSPMEKSLVHYQSGAAKLEARFSAGRVNRPWRECESGLYQGFRQYVKNTFSFKGRTEVQLLDLADSLIRKADYFSPGINEFDRIADKWESFIENCKQSETPLEAVASPLSNMERMYQEALAKQAAREAAEGGSAA